MFEFSVDFKKAFDSVHREALWDLLKVSRIFACIVGLLILIPND